MGSTAASVSAGLAASTAKLAQERPALRPPLPPIPPHLRPQNIKMAPIAGDESFYDLGGGGGTKSPATESLLTTPGSVYDNNEYSPASGKFKGFPYIDGAPRKRSESPSSKQNGNNFSLLVDKSTQTSGTNLSQGSDKTAICNE